MSTPPLFIVGAPRSGNTLTRRVLMASGQIYIPPETYVIGEIIERWPRWFWLSWREKVWLLCAYFDRHKHRADLDIESFSPFADDAITWPKAHQTLPALFDALYAFMGREHGYPAARWGDKTPWNTMHLRAIVRRYPQAWYLHLIRDGRDAVASQIKADMRDMSGSAERWVVANRACLKHLPKGPRTLAMRYEDLVRDPEESFARIFDWAGLRFEPRFLTEMPQKLGDVGVHAHHAQVLRPITPDSIGKWRQSLSPEALTQLSPEFRKMMAELSYEMAD